MKIKKITAAVLLTVLILSLCACGKDKPSTEEENETAVQSEAEEAKKESENENEPSDGIVSVFSYKPDTFCPILSNNNANVRMLKMIFESLTVLGDDMRPKPCLASSWTAGDTADKWTVALRSGVRWHDSSGFSAEDAVYTVNSIIAHPESPYAESLANVESVRAEGAYKIVFTLREPDPCFVNLLNFPIIKKGSIGADTAEFSPNGTGAYVFEDRNEGNVYYLSANPAWWGGEISNKLIRVRMLPDKDTALYAFGSDNIDIAAADNTDWGKYVDAAESTYALIKTPVYHFIGLNNKNTILSDAGVRNAISYAADRNGICETVFMQSGETANVPLRSEWYVYGSQKTEYSRDIGAARKEIEACGWELTDNKAYRKKSGRKTLRLRLDILINEDNIMRENIAQTVESNLTDAGFEVTVTKVPFEEYEKRIANGKYDMFIGSCIIPADMNLDFMLGEGNMFGFEDEEMQYVLNELKTKKTEDEVVETYAEIINLFEQLNPVVGLAFQNSVAVYGKGLEGEFKPNYYDIYSGIESLIKK